jgi:hypothetical protein
VLEVVMMIKMLLLVLAAAFALAADANLMASAQTRWIAGAQPRAYDLAAGRDTQSDEGAQGQFGASNKASGANPNDDQDDGPKVRKKIEDRPARERFDRTEDRFRTREDDRLRGRNYRD